MGKKKRKPRLSPEEERRLTLSIAFYEGLLRFVADDAMRVDVWPENRRILSEAIDDYIDNYEIPYEFVTNWVVPSRWFNQYLIPVITHMRKHNGATFLTYKKTPLWV